jgi:endonuclease YncB( thermonuclease family)
MLARQIVFAFTALLTLSAIIAAEPKQVHLLTGKVVGVSDGDTITVLDEAKPQYKIRLVGIDAPKSGRHSGHARCKSSPT